MALQFRHSCGPALCPLSRARLRRSVAIRTTWKNQRVTDVGPQDQCRTDLCDKTVRVIEKPGFNLRLHHPQMLTERQKLNFSTHHQRSQLREWGHVSDLGPYLDRRLL